MKTNYKLAIRFLLLNVGLFTLLGGAIYFFFNKYSYVDFYKRLETRASISARYKFESDDSSAEAVQRLREQHLEKLPNEKEYIVQLPLKINFQEIANQNALPQSFLEDVWQNKVARFKKGGTFYAGIVYQEQKESYIVIVSASNYVEAHHMAFLRNLLLVGLLLIALTTLYFSKYFSKYVFTPIRQITDKVKQISTDNFHLRLEEGDTNNEIRELTHTFNDLLNRVETAFETQKNFISNASHELGTPLTAIIGEADVALIRDRSAEEYKETLIDILQQAERLDNITKSLLFLAQTGYEGKKITFEIFRLDELVWNVKETIDKLNPQNNIHIDFSLFPQNPKKLKINGNRQLMHLAVANLLTNACKYSHNQEVIVSIASSDSSIILVVKDQGIGIPTSELPFIYDPFFRASNTHLFDGYGIGLPLTRNIIRLHKGTINVSSQENKGTTVEILLPLAFPYIE